MNEEGNDFTKMLCGVSSTLAGLGLASLSIFPAQDPHGVRHWLWYAVVLFALTSFRCLDKLMDAVSDSVGDEYNIWPKHKPIFDKRIVDFGLAIWPFALGWLAFAIGMFNLGQYIGISPVVNYAGVGTMIAFMVSFFIRPL